MVSFAGFVPVDKPRVVIAVAVDEPTEIHTGGKVAAPVFSEIAAAAMLQLGIAPDPNAVELEVAVQDNTIFRGRSHCAGIFGVGQAQRFDA